MLCNKSTGQVFPTDLPGGETQLTELATLFVSVLAEGPFPPGTGWARGGPCHRSELTTWTHSQLKAPGRVMEHRTAGTALGRADHSQTPSQPQAPQPLSPAASTHDRTWGSPSRGWGASPPSPRALWGLARAQDKPGTQKAFAD